MFDNKRVLAINYADDKFEYQRKYNTKTAYEKGKVDKVIEYSPRDIDNDFFQDNKVIFNYERGAGLWLWKPYVILKTLEQMDEGEYLFYCDAGSFYVNPVKKLINVMEKCHIDLMTFELPLLARQFTKKETFVRMEYDDYSQNQICASYILIKKSSFSLSILKEWFTYMQDEICVSYKHFTQEEFPDYVSHREDQSVFSIVCRKNGIIPFRDPSQYGERPWEYGWIKSYEGRWKRWTLNEKKYSTSSYPKVVVSNRKINPLVFKKKELYKSILWKIGLYNRYYYKYRFDALI